MTTKIAETETRIKRCAVCRIDLKGRFVYVDEKAQTLFGLSLEQLFAQPIIDYLDEADHAVIQRLLSHHNRYESFFKTARVSMVNADGDPFKAWIVASLSFAAGNPVNFLILINPEEPALLPERDVSESTSYKTFLRALIDLHAPVDILETIRPLHDFVHEAHVLAYGIDGDNLNPLARTDAGAEIVPEPTELHRHVAQSGERYSLSDEEAVRQAVERHGTAPDEILRKYDCADGKSFLLRIFFYSDTESPETQQAITRAHQGLSLLRRVLPAPVVKEIDPSRITDSVEIAHPARSGAETDQVTDMDELGVARLALDSEGLVVNHNGATPGLVLGQAASADIVVGMHYRELIARIATRTEGETVRHLETVCDAVLSTGMPVRVSLSVVLQDESEAVLVISRCTDTEKAYGFDMLIVPTGSGLVTQDARIENSVVTAFLNDVRAAVDTASKVSYKLGHAKHSRLDEKSNFDLLCLKEGLDKTVDSVSDYLEFLKIVSSPSKPTTADLNLVMKELQQKLKATHPHTSVKFNHKGLPKLTGDPSTLGFVLHELMSDIVPFATGNKSSMFVSAVDHGETTEIVFKSDAAVPRGHITRLAEFFERSVTGENEPRPASYSGLYAARYLLGRIGGKAVVAMSGRGVEIRLTIPDGVPALPAAADTLKRSDLTGIGDNE